MFVWVVWKWWRVWWKSLPANKKSLGAAFLLRVSPMTPGKFTRSHTEWLFTLYLSGYRYANGSPNTFIKTWGRCPSLPPLSLPQMTNCPKWPQFQRPHIYICIAYITYITYSLVWSQHSSLSASIYASCAPSTSHFPANSRLAVW